MFGDNPNDPRLRAAWHDFCDQLRDAGELVFHDTTPGHDIDRAKGLRLLARNISLGLQFHLDNRDPDWPELMHYFDPVRKQGGDNTDALYLGAPINGENTYRVSGHRGSARFVAFTVLEDGATPWGGAVVGSLINEELAVEPDGSFELFVGPEPQPGNWIRTTPGSWRLTIRQFFADWENEQPMVARICSWVVWCRVIGLLRQQHFIPQPELAITPVTRKLAPKIRARAMPMALISNLFLDALLFIVN